MAQTVAESGMLLLFLEYISEVKKCYIKKVFCLGFDFVFTIIGEKNTQDLRTSV